MRSRSMQQNTLSSQREKTSPLPAPCSLSQLSQSSATRVLGADITNRSPTPPPLLSQPQKAPSVSSQKHARSPSIPPVAKTLIWSTKQTDLPFEHLQETTATLLASAHKINTKQWPILLPTCDDFLDLVLSEHADGKRAPQSITRRRSRSPAEYAMREVSEAHFSAQDGAHLSWRDDEGTSEGQVDSKEQVDVTLEYRDSYTDSQPRKRARQQTDASVEDVSSAVPEWMLAERSFDQFADSEGRNTSAFITPISTHLLLSTGASDTALEAAAAPPHAREMDCRSFYSRAEEQANATAEEDIDASTLADSGLLSVTTPQRGLQHLCMPARLLDTELPSWQVLTATSNGPADTGELVALTPQGGRRVRIVNAVDHTVVYSPGSLEDVSPILFASGEHGGRRWDTLASEQFTCPTPSHFQNEEGAQKRRESRSGNEHLVEDFEVTQALFPHTFDCSADGNDVDKGAHTERFVDELDDSSAHPGLSTTVLQMASDTFEELQCSLIQWQ